MKGVVVRSTGLWYEVETAEGRVVARLRGKFKLENKKITNPIAVGDQVILEKEEQSKDEYVITQIKERTNYVIRQSPRKKGHDHLLASNVDQGVVIVTLRMPRTSTGFIDRFLITLEAYRIPGVILFNKSDIYNDSDLELFRELEKTYTDLGYKVYLTSFQNEVSEMRDLLANKVSLLVGHSGTGKSTLVNKLIPEVSQATSEVSTFANKGVHTTTFAERFTLDETSFVIDTPGIKELALSEIESDELSHYFPEMRDLLGQCKYHNCQHKDEPNCAVKEGVGETISKRRYDSYLSILSD